MPRQGLDSYRERLAVPLRWWVQATMFLATVWLAFVVALPVWVACVAAGLLAAATYGLFLWVGSAQVCVEGRELRAGRAHVDVVHLGEPEVLDKEQTRRALGVDADARAYLLTRPYLKRALRVPLHDPADRTPYWLISTRHPRRLGAAIAAARGAGVDGEGH